MTNNILTIADGDYGYPTSTIATLVQGQYGQSLPLEIRDLAGNVVNLTGFSTLSAIKSSERGRVTSIVGAITLSGTPTVAPQLSWLLDEADTGIAGTFNLVLSISNGTVTHETHPVELVILPNPAINAVAAPGVVGITTAQKTLLAAIQGLTGLVKIAAGSATGVAIQSFMQTFLESATAIAARLNLLPSYTGNTGKVLAVNGAETDVEWVAQSGGGAVDSVFGRTGVVVAAEDDYALSQIADDSDLAKSSAAAAINTLAASLDGMETTTQAHYDNTSNPHSVTAAQVGASALRPTQTDIAGTTHTLTTANEGQIVASQSGSATVFTVPLNSAQAFTVGSIVGVEQQGAGVLTITATSGVTLNGVDGASKAITGQWKAAALRKVSTNGWVIIGAI